MPDLSKPRESQPVEVPTAGPSRRFVLARTRASAMWVATITAAFILLLLLIFVLQNGQVIRVSFFGADGDLPLGVALLLAMTGGVLAVALPGVGRIIQLRRLARRRMGSTSAGDASERRKPLYEPPIGQTVRDGRLPASRGPKDRLRALLTRR
ncbi:LapA family protein [Microbispora bryophytorum]|uniref:LapA family protein n=1 Tax=Microbispora bryophytorum TaxID=1460882 RepID=UPI0033C7C794